MATSKKPGGGKSAAGGEKPAARGRTTRPKADEPVADLEVTAVELSAGPDPVARPAGDGGLAAATAALRESAGDLAKATDALRAATRDVRALRAELDELRGHVRSVVKEAADGLAGVRRLRTGAEAATEQVAALKEEAAGLGERLGELRQEAGRPAAEPGNRLGVEVDHGVVVAEVLPGGMAATAGLVHGDVVESVNGTPVHTAAGFRDAVLGVPDGSELTVRIRRGGSPLHMVGRVGPAGEDGNRVGVVVDPGVVVTVVTPASPAAAAGLARGDVIDRAAGQEVHTGEDLRAAVRAVRPGGEIALAVARDGEVREVVARLDPPGGAGPDDGGKG
ncbi:MAG: hypothetical protein C0501_03865 [Isosphaera sp.]|nr:hypothetical protein [Isosphaera sp.]